MAQGWGKRIIRCPFCDWKRRGSPLTAMEMAEYWQHLKEHFRKGDITEKQLEREHTKICSW